MTKFRLKLAITFILVIACAMILTGVFAARIMVESNRDVLKMALEREMEVILASRAWTNSDALKDMIEFYADQMKLSNEVLQSRLTLMDAQGKVTADSDSDPNTMENDLHRPEIQQAILQGIGYDQRYSETLQQNMLYAAVPVKENQQTIGYLRASISLQQVDAALYRLWLNLGLGLFLLFLLSAILSYRIASTITKPIEKITEVAKQISTSQSVERIRVVGKDEIADLAKEINQMADSLELQMEVIRDREASLNNIVANMSSGLMMIDREQRVVLLNRAAEEMIGFSAEQLVGKSFFEFKQHFEFLKLVEQSLNKHERIREELLFFYPEERLLDVHSIPIIEEQDSNTGLMIVMHDITELRKLERLRSEFVANVSHELKTPLAAVKGFSETLLAGALEDKATARSFIQIIYDESERLNRLISDTLDLSKIESKRIPLNFSAIHLSDFMAKVSHVMATEAQKKNIQLAINVHEDMYIEADEDCLRQIMINLIANGINYTPEEGSVTVHVESEIEPDTTKHSMIRICVIDTGIGIPKKDIPRIFERFYRVDKARSRVSGGTGLRLAIVKHLVELHHGSIQVESKVGLGSQFIVELPIIHE